MALCVTVALLAACAGPPRPSSDIGGGDYRRDGPGDRTPDELSAIPDAVPRVEAFRSGTLRPYTVAGRRFEPVTHDRPMRQRGTASWYGRQFHGRATASGEPFDMYAMTAAHPTMPLPSYARVRHLGNGREVVVRVNDRGPFRAGRIIDLSYAAAVRLGMIRSGSAQVEVERLTHDAIQAGTWRERTDTVAPDPVLAQAPSMAEPARETAPAPATPAPAESPRFVLETRAEPVVARDAPPPGGVVSGQAYWLQLGAFSARDGAEGFQRQVGQTVEWLAPLLAIISDQALYRLQAGPYASREQADSAARMVRDSLHLLPMIVER